MYVYSCKNEEKLYQNSKSIQILLKLERSEINLIGDRMNRNCTWYNEYDHIIHFKLIHFCHGIFVVEKLCNYCCNHQHMIATIGRL